ncbi:ubiquitin-like-specific protease ESD4 [Magnolia sinica]|uniref:ubiquitin-like-specific protease ESD4 n=1 Tax=Magnolia sinica TaxID=86752 RepID=UPI002659E350|nr:ubiquitin-like-specific protease ESD4 [Magnolia sinica]
MINAQFFDVIRANENGGFLGGGGKWPLKRSDSRNETSSHNQLEPWPPSEVISKYTELMAIRENSGGHNLLKCHFFNAWFHKYVCTTRIIAKGDKKIEDIYYDRNDVKIECIIRKIPYDLKSKEKIMIPLNEMSHWYLLVIDLKRKIFSIYSSLKGHQTSTYINTMVSRLKIHLLKNCEIECDGFTVSIDQECPQQPNSVDCGVYLMKFMECLSRGDVFDFNSACRLITIRKEYNSYMELFLLKCGWG